MCALDCIFVRLADALAGEDGLRVLKRHLAQPREATSGDKHPRGATLGDDLFGNLPMALSIEDKERITRKWDLQNGSSSDADLQNGDPQNGTSSDADQQQQQQQRPPQQKLLDLEEVFHWLSESHPPPPGRGLQPSRRTNSKCQQ